MWSDISAIDATRVQAYELTVSLTSTDEDSCTQEAPFVYDLDQVHTHILYLNHYGIMH